MNKLFNLQKEKIVLLESITKRVIFFLWCVLFVFVFVACSNPNQKDEIDKDPVEVPNLINLDLDTAKDILLSKDLIPIVEEIYDEEIAIGRIINTSPSFGESLPENSQITLYTSLGPYEIQTKDAVIEWYYIDSNKEDEWTISSPYIEGNTLILPCSATFSKNFKWKKYGLASLTDTFSKTVPLEFHADYSRNNGKPFGDYKAQTIEYLCIEIPLSELEADKPTSIYTRLSIEINGKQQDIRVNFYLTW